MATAAGSCVPSENGLRRRWGARLVQWTRSRVELTWIVYGQQLDTVGLNNALAAGAGLIFVGDRDGGDDDDDAGHDDDDANRVVQAA